MLHNLALYANTPLPLGFKMCPSDAGQFFTGKAFASWKKGREAEGKAQSAIVSRLNDVIRSIGYLGKVLSKRR